ncbi:hypothetical protein [Caldivirga maquilingensis]|uniref:Uncharacterized protein n=1 Tax=Caldivirga maquilingensis (strain ATCC 700844 / DSM 13496 / JCM 10307 / IC-167) TaxID=397948 RepID=A8MDI1_CALMQ|nr:hypothetical protein [Caldivirga maquilingensis]ABW01837.1 hypothetical protein Cmaq_1006 [Caldivirga maquilingensis IC-167]
MVIALYCTNCSRVVMVFRRLRPYNEIWELLIKKTGGRCPYCGYKFTKLDVRHASYSIGDRVSRGMEITLNATNL